MCLFECVWVCVCVCVSARVGVCVYVQIYILFHTSPVMFLYLPDRPIYTGNLTGPSPTRGQKEYSWPYSVWVNSIHWDLHTLGSLTKQTPGTGLSHQLWLSSSLYQIVCSNKKGAPSAHSLGYGLWGSLEEAIKGIRNMGWVGASLIFFCASITTFAAQNIKSKLRFN